MGDDALAKAAYEAYNKAWDRVGVLAYEELAPRQQLAWASVAHTVLRAAGYNELVALVRKFAEWVQGERDACPDRWVPETPACDERCPRWTECKLPSLAEQIKAILQRAGKKEPAGRKRKG